MFRLVVMNCQEKSDLRQAVMLLLKDMRVAGSVDLGECYTDGVYYLQTVNCLDKDILPVIDVLLPAAGADVRVYHTAREMRADCKKYEVADTRCFKTLLERVTFHMRRRQIDRRLKPDDIMCMLPAAAYELDEEALISALNEVLPY